VRHETGPSSFRGGTGSRAAHEKGLLGEVRIEKASRWKETRLVEEFETHAKGGTSINQFERFPSGGVSEEKFRRKRRGNGRANAAQAILSWKRGA